VRLKTTTTAVTTMMMTWCEYRRSATTTAIFNISYMSVTLINDLLTIHSILQELLMLVTVKVYVMMKQPLRPQCW